MRSKAVRTLAALLLGGALFACGDDGEGAASSAPDTATTGVDDTSVAADGGTTGQDSITGEDSGTTGEDSGPTGEDGATTGEDSGTTGGEDGGGPPPADAGDTGPTGPCDAFCVAVLAAGCEGGPDTMENCVSGCQVLADSCPDKFGAAAACVAGGAEYTCVDGQPLPTGCEAEVVELLACGEPCTALCEAVLEADCESGPSDLEGCQTWCADSGQACPAEFAANQACVGSDPDIQCVDGMPVQKGCEDEQLALSLCVDPCLPFCQATVAADCEGGPASLGDCYSYCNGLAAACPEQMVSTVLCAGLDIDMSCVDGMPSPKGCEAEQAALLACGDSSDPMSLCEQACPDVVAADCASGPPTAEACVTGCADILSGPCSADQAVLMACAGSDPSYVCLEPSGFPAPVGCEADSKALMECIAGL